MDIALCNPHANLRFWETYHVHLQGKKLAEHETSVRQVARQIGSADFLP
jgi:hypothetical protein